MKILALSGSTRPGSYNAVLLDAAVRGAREAGAQVTRVQLRDFPMPLYDAELEAAHGLPEGARRLKALLKAHDGLLLASPEFNGSVSGVLKNAIDWLSRSEPGEPPRAAFQGKVAGLLSASPGPRGGLQGLLHLREVLSHLQMLVLPRLVTHPHASQGLQDEAPARALGAELARVQPAAVAA